MARIKEQRIRITIMAVIHEDSIEFEQYHQTHKNTLVPVK